MILQRINNLNNPEGFTVMGVIVTILVISLICFVCLFGFASCSKKVLSKEVKTSYEGFATIPEAHFSLGGVCSGFAYYTETPVWMWRAGAVVGTLLSGGIIIIIYGIVWIFAPHMDTVPEDYEKVTQ